MRCLLVSPSCISVHPFARRIGLFFLMRYLLFGASFVSKGLIPIAYCDWVHDVVPAPPHMVPSFGYPVFGNGTLRIRIDGSNEEHSFRCALLAGGFGRWYLSKAAYPARLYAPAQLPPPSVWATIMIIPPL